jgi:hypothetical protein
MKEGDRDREMRDEMKRNEVKEDEEGQRGKERETIKGALKRDHHPCSRGQHS